MAGKDDEEDDGGDGHYEDEDDDDYDDDDDDDANSILAELEADPLSHVADYHFSEQQLGWIKTHYQHSGSFLITHGLKPFDDEDCRMGKSIVEQMMD